MIIRVDMSKTAAFGFLCFFWVSLGYFPAAGMCQEFNPYASFSPYAANPSLTFQAVPPYENRELQSFSSIPEPQFDAMTSYREEAYRAFGNLQQPNVQVKNYVERNYSGFNPMSQIQSPVLKSLNETPYASFSPFNAFKK